MSCDIVGSAFREEEPSLINVLNALLGQNSKAKGETLLNINADATLSRHANQPS